MAMRMRQSLADLERAFVEETAEDSARQQARRYAAVERSRQRTVDRRHRHGSVRFVVLVLMLIGTAVAVTVAMFEILYAVMA
jgi:hypothetical protein